jgi:hypothetical protein
MRPRGAHAALVTAWAPALASAALVAWFSVGPWSGNLVARFGPSPGQYLSMGYRAHKFHAEGVHFLAESALEGNLFNSYGMGGFIGYWLSPRLRTFIEMRGRRAGETFLDVLDRRDVDIFFGIGFPGWWHSVFTTTHLERVPGWIPVSRSFRHAIYLRDDARNRENLARVANYYRDQGIPFDPRNGFDASAVIRARPDWAIEHSMLPNDYHEILEQTSSSDAKKRLKARNALGIIYFLAGATSLQIDWDRQTAEEFPTDRGSRQRLLYALLRVDAIREAHAVARALIDIDAHDRWTRDLVKLLKKYRKLTKPSVAAFAGRDLQVYKNHLLWKKAPITTSQSWALEHEMSTESLPLRRAER